MRAVREDNRDEMIVSVVSDRDARRAYAAIRDAVETRLKERLGVRIRAEVVAPGALDALTEVDVVPEAEAVPRRPERRRLIVDYLCNAFTPDRPRLWDGGATAGLAA